ncbi:MAG: CBS domain-containing protein [Phycisphaeraceae bacterium]|nr:MAG: CBS domain-containing protein [Phycisphaeraceae bacterium]
MSRALVILRRLQVRLGLRRDWYLICLGAGVGVVTAFGAIAFMGLLHWAEDGFADLQGRWAWWLLPIPPMIGALITGILVHRFAREAKGGGVPEVMDAVYRRGAVIRPRVAVVKSVASAATIGSGGSAGAEGPIVQIGAAIGSAIGQWLRVSREQAGTLLGCGAAAGIASVFNAPIAGVFFVLEVLLRDFSIRTFIPIVVASVFSAAVTQSVLGRNVAIFDVGAVREQYVFTLWEAPSYLVLGLLCGLLAVVFIKALYKTEDLADKAPLHPMLRPVAGAFLLGLLGIAYLAIVAAAGSPQTLPGFFGNGYAVITELLNPATFGVVAGEAAANVPAAAPMVAEEGSRLPTALWLLLILVACKLVGTCFTLGSGGSGGVFAPSLFLGAGAGAAFGVALDHLGLLPPGVSPASYALVGMAAVVAGATHAPLTAILIVFEITRDVYVLLPLMLAAVIATTVAQLFLRDSIYSLRLRRRGVLIGTAADLSILRRLTARQTPLSPHVAVHSSDALGRLLELHRDSNVVDFVVVDDAGEYLGMVTGQDLRTALIEREAMPLLLVEDLMRTDLPTVDADETLDTVMDKFSRHDVSSLAMTTAAQDHAGKAGEQVLGLITRAKLMQRYQQALREM